MNSVFKKNIFIIIAVLILSSASFFVGIKYGEKKIPDITKVTELSNKEKDKPEKVDFSTFWKVWSLIDEKYVPSGTTTVKTEDRVWGAISGLANSLGDPFTTFLPPEENKAFTTEISGKFEGVGMEIAIKEGYLVVVAPLKDTPAYKAGILPGDKILKINDSNTSSLRVDQAVKIIRGPKGTTVTLLVERTGKKSPIEVKIIRDTIQIPTIDTELKSISSPNLNTGSSTDNTVGKDETVSKKDVFIIKLYNFSEPSTYLFQNALREFILSGSDKLVLDLRGNPGGYLGASIEIASWFLPIGKVVVREDFGGNQDEIVHRSRGYNVFSNLKMVVLVNKGSASASEILAGALQEHGIAKLVGTDTFGKGSVQELVKITPETSFKVTIAKWLTPLGKSISDGGLKPDYFVDKTEKDMENDKDPQLDKAIEILNKK